MSELSAQLVAANDLPGPDFHDLVEFLAQRPADLAVLHTATGKGPSVIAWQSALTIELTSAGELRCLPAADMPTLQIPAGSGEHLLAALDRMRESVKFRGISNDLIGAWIGHIGYDIARLTEVLPARAADDTHWPLLRWSIYDFYLQLTGAGTWAAYTYEWNVARNDSAAQRLARIRELLASAAAERRAAVRPPVSQLIAATGHGNFLAAIGRAKEYIAAGDIYQANLAQRWTIHTDAAPAAVYRRLCQASPADYSAFLKFGKYAAISASPELLLERQGPHLTTRPIKGTRPRDLADKVRDAAQADALLHSEKDQAELAMIVDLLRNDLGRVAAFGSVKVTEPRMLERLPTLWHTVAEITAELAPGSSWAALIAALCPGGSVTGAPKIRAIEIIDELECHRRGLYCGSIGYISTGSSAALNIAIRTIQMMGQTAHVWAGGGIVADSDPELEYQESLHKAAAMFRALGLKEP